MGLEALLSKMAGKLAGRRVVPPLPQGRSARIADDDRSEDLPADQAGGENSTALFIHYKDSKGQVSQRRIVCKAYEDDNGCIRAFCLERRAPRRFRVDRIIEAASIDTGEVYETSVLLALLRHGVIVTDERLRRVMTILTFLMRCDEETHPLEIEVIEQAATSFALRFDGSEETIAEGVRYARSLAPDADDFIRAIRWIAKRADSAQLVRLIAPMAERVIVADGRIKSEEAYFGGLLKDALAEIS